MLKKEEIELYIDCTLCDIRDFEIFVNNSNYVYNHDILIFLNDLKCRFLEMKEEL